MKLKPIRAALRLRRIPANTVVHTPTEAEAKELLAILHENYNYKLTYMNLIESSRCYSDPSVLCFIFDANRRIGHCYRSYFEREGYTILTLAEFKEQYVEEESHNLSQNSTNCDKSQELNLCELLKGHEGETFYHLMYGEVECKGIDKDGFIAFTDSKIPTIYDDGKYDQHANVVLYPSHTLYEQYPLDPYSAWMKWQEEQKKPFIYIHWGEVDCNGDEEEDYTGNTYFRTSTDRDECIEEIKAIIEKYSKK